MVVTCHPTEDCVVDAVDSPAGRRETIIGNKGRDMLVVPDVNAHAGVVPSRGGSGFNSATITLRRAQGSYASSATGFTFINRAAMAGIAVRTSLWAWGVRCPLLQAQCARHRSPWQGILDYLITKVAPDGVTSHRKHYLPSAPACSCGTNATMMAVVLHAHAGFRRQSRCSHCLNGPETRRASCRQSDDVRGHQTPRCRASFVPLSAPRSCCSASPRPRASASQERIVLPDLVST